MMDPWQVIFFVFAVLLAVLVGALIPVLSQLRSTLKSSQTWLDRLGPKLDGTLVEARELSRRLNSSGAELETGVKRARKLLDAAGDVGQSVQKLNRSLSTAAKVGIAVGPAVVAAARAFTESDDHRDGRPDRQAQKEAAPTPAAETASPEPDSNAKETTR